MAERFDPYYKWLGIPPDEQPANHYRLLGLRVFEADSDVIEHAADRLMSHLRTLQIGQHASRSQQILNEVAIARITLLDPIQKRNYDASLPQPDEVNEPLDISLEPIAPVLTRPPAGRVKKRHRLKPKRSALRPVVGVSAAIVAVAIVAGIIVRGGQSIRDATDFWSVSRAVSDSPARPDPPPGEVGPRSADNESKTEPPETNKPAEPADTDPGRQDDGQSNAASAPPQQPPPADSVEPTLVFDFSDEAHLKQYWEWNYAWTFADDGGRAARGAQSIFKSRQQFAGDLTIDMEFRFGQAKFSNTGGCWVTLWGQRLVITNGWRPLNAKIHIHREGNTIVFSYNGAARRIEVSPEVMAQPTPIEIRWRSRTSHFKRIEITSHRMTPLPG